MNAVKTFHLLAALAFMLAPCAGAAAAKLPLPPWLAEASKRAMPQEKDTDTGAAILHDEAIITVSPNGVISRNVRQAALIVTRAGRGAAQVKIPYDLSASKITSFKAWLVQPDGSGKTYAMKDARDMALAPQAVYAELRVLTLSAAGDAGENCVFAYDYTLEDKSIFGQDGWRFQQSIPVALSRVTYKLPKGWTIKALTENHAPIAPSISADGNASTWELRDLPMIRTEPLGPPLSRIAPRIYFDLIPPNAPAPGAGANANAGAPPRLVFPDWAAVATYAAKLNAAPATPDATVAAKARELLAPLGANASLWERINTLARFAQKTNYVEIAMNAGTGGGMTPRPATEVLKTSYGDCKDKTALLRALLAAAGIESYAVAAYSSDRYQVTADWPATRQFNHIITAIKIAGPSVAPSALPAIMEHPTLGWLLFFDPTHPYTPLGDLVSDEQGSLVLVLADGEKNPLVRLPFAAPADDCVTREVEAALSDTGAITANLKEHSTGQAAVRERVLYRTPKTPKDKFDDRNREWLNAGAPAAKILKTEVSDSQERGTFDLALEFTATDYARTMRGKLLIFKPAIAGRRDAVWPVKPTRVYPVIIAPSSYSETALITIPDGWTVDELPPPVEVTARFGRYKATTTFDAAKRQVRHQREFETKAAEIPVAEYETVRQFFETVRKAEQTPVALRRQ